MTAATLITQPEYAKKRTSGAGILRLARRPEPLISRGRLRAYRRMVLGRL